MTLSRMIPLPESRAVLSAPPARFKSGRRRPASNRASRSTHGACASKLSTRAGQVHRFKVRNFRLSKVRNFRLTLTSGRQT